MSTIALWFVAACGTSTPSEPPDPAAAPPPSGEAAPPPEGSAVSSSLVVPASNRERAARLTEIERAIRDPATPLAALTDLGHAEQRILRVLAQDPVAARAVLPMVDEDVRESVQLLLEGTVALGRTVTRPRTDLPPWRIVEPRPADELLGYYRAAEAEHGVPWTILASINLNETRMGRLRGTSVVGARGPMQFMPETWAKYGDGDVEDDEDAIMAAGRYVAASGWSRDPDKAIWHYNHSDAYVTAIRRFAAAMDDEPRMFHALRGWRVYYRTVAGSIWLRTGYEQAERIPIARYCEPVGEPYCPALH